ncbi:unnamed protein product [Musa acuminata subsp. burmannicoides]
MAPPSPPLWWVGIFLLVELLLLPRGLAKNDDEACLSDLRRSLTDPSGSLRNWTRANFAAPCNGFTSYLHGVTCNNGRIYKLSLAGLALGGAISPYVSNCTNLQSLDLSSNQLAGPIPPELSALLNLAVLNLSSNRLSGPIPPQLALRRLPQRHRPPLQPSPGPIPDQLGLLVRLSTFDVSYNRLEGPHPCPARQPVGHLAGAAAVQRQLLHRQPGPLRVSPAAHKGEGSLGARHCRDWSRERASQLGAQFHRRLHLASGHGAGSHDGR